MTEAKPRYQAPALVKGLEILELLASTSKGMSLVEIATALGRSKSELYRMLVVLEERGYAEKSERSDDYLLTDKMFDIATRRPPVGSLVTIALPFMQNLAAEIDQSCHVAVLNGPNIVVLNRIEAPGELGFAVRLGYRRRIDHSTSGVVIFSRLTTEKAEHHLKALEAVADDFDHDAFEKRCAKAITKGYFERESSTVRGIIDISVPITDRSGVVLAALTVPFIERKTMPLEKPAAIKRLCKAGALISAAL